MNGIFSFLLAALAGAAMALQGACNTAAARVVGVAENTFLVHLVGLVTIGLVLLCGGGRGDWSKLAEIPKYGWLGGVLSAVIIFAVIAGMKSLGVGNATAVIILFQVAMALLIDSFGWFGAERVDFAWIRVVGLVLLVVGTKLVFTKAG